MELSKSNERWGCLLPFFLLLPLPGLSSLRLLPDSLPASPPVLSGNVLTAHIHCWSTLVHTIRRRPLLARSSRSYDSIFGRNGTFLSCRRTLPVRSFLSFPDIAPILRNFTLSLSLFYSFFFLFFLFDTYVSHIMAKVPKRVSRVHLKGEKREKKAHRGRASHFCILPRVPIKSSSHCGAFHAAKSRR